MLRKFKAWVKCLAQIDGSSESEYFLAYIKDHLASALRLSLTMISDNFLDD